MRAPPPRFGRRRCCFAPAGRQGCAAGRWPCDCSARSGTGGHAGPARNGPSLTSAAMRNAVSSLAPVAAPTPRRTSRRRIGTRVAAHLRLRAAAPSVARWRYGRCRPPVRGQACAAPQHPSDVQAAWAARTCAKLARAPCDHLLSFSGCVRSGRGGIGRRAGFRFQWDSREGSSPFARTSACQLCQQGFPAPRALPGLYWRRNVEHHF